MSYEYMNDFDASLHGGLSHSDGTEEDAMEALRVYQESFSEEDAMEAFCVYRESFPEAEANTFLAGWTACNYYHQKRQE